MIDRSMADDELSQIELDAEGYELENYPISGVQLMAIIQRLRFAEESARAAIPFMNMHIGRARMARANNAWALPRLGVLVFSLCAGLAGCVISGTLLKLDAFLRTGIGEFDAVMVGFIILSFIIPFCTAMLPLMAWIDRLAQRNLDAGVYDAED